MDYPPYVNAYNSISTLFAGIQNAAVPPKVTQDFLESVLNLKSSSHRALIPLLKKLGFIGGDNVPTQAYRDFRDSNQASTVMAERLKDAYRSLFTANEYAYKLNKSDLQSKFKNITGAGEDDKVIPSVTNTFLELSKYANWDGATPLKRATPEPSNGTGGSVGRDREDQQNAELRLSYTINLNLPATTEIEVFNAIFKSLRENLLRQL